MIAVVLLLLFCCVVLLGGGAAVAYWYFYHYLEAPAPQPSITPPPTPSITPPPTPSITPTPPTPSITPPPTPTITPPPTPSITPPTPKTGGSTDGVVSAADSWTPIPGTSYRRAKASKSAVDAVVAASNDLRRNADDLHAQGWKFHSEYGDAKRRPYVWDDSLADLAAKNSIESCDLQHPSFQPFNRYHCINRSGNWDGDRGACMAGGNENICFPIPENASLKDKTVGEAMLGCVHGMGHGERDVFLAHATKESTAPVVEGKTTGHWATIVNPSYTRMGAAWIDCGDKPGQQGISHDQLSWIYAA